MRVLPLLAAVLVASLLAPTVAAVPNPWGDPFDDLEPVTDPLYAQMGPVCAQLLEDLREDGTLGNHGPWEPHWYENDFWRTNPQCAELRDEIQWKYSVYEDLGHQQYCDYSNGVNCVAINHPACDFAIILNSGSLYWCIGGFNPKN